jgi:hypothetical protein
MSFSGPGASTERALGGSVIIVSGLPRSGTSMTMRMLEAGGLEVVTDNLRAADDSNPMGYYEDARVKQLRDGYHEWLASATGKAVKVVSPLLEHLPTRHSYQLIFMLRPVEEILASQRRMLSRSGQDAGKGTDEELTSAYRKHLTRIESWLADQPNLDTMYVRYRDILDDPEGNAIRIGRFLGRPLDQRSMVGVVDRSLYRERDES